MAFAREVRCAVNRRWPVLVPVLRTVRRLENATAWGVFWIANGQPDRAARCMARAERLAARLAPWRPQEGPGAVRLGLASSWPVSTPTA